MPRSLRSPADFVLMIETPFSEMEIQTTVTVGLHLFHSNRMALPLEVHLCPPGMEAHGWRRWAEKVLRNGPDGLKIALSERAPDIN